ncbi:DUF3833 domain-containing protein [Lentisphaera profundi]|uniref:DUF3833 domain-containing protein n=1 Tax=Lentisphaera profundi TaxID=1658616 RepID=A0ABY7VMP9_9BACT|nr:DUF3833 domain-containing protein [Lentisphaera profundi]WDE95313.1 DUF3833 domain-containing protein [Lentisphaera profundi]
MKLVKSFLIILIAILLISCSSSSKLQAYKNSEPKLDLQEYFTGPIKAWGIVQDRSGKVIRRFDVSMIGSWQGNVGTLKEDFIYYDGETQQRTWTITKIDNKQYLASASDILGDAEATVEGNAMRWVYEMDLPVSDTTYRIKFDDWMFLMNDGVLINRSYLKKFGFTVAELTLFMQKQ